MSLDDLDAAVRTNLDRVRDRIAEACHRCGREEATVQLVGVSKYVGARETAALVRAGCEVLGESRPQQLWEKAAAPELQGLVISWRLVGHLQRNKTQRTVEVAASIDSVDSPRLLRAINSAAEAGGEPQTVLLEVNCSGDPEKHGLAPDACGDIVASLGEYPHVRVDGLMTMAAREGGSDVARRNFAALRDLRDRLATPELPLAELSMGMSGDLEEAILEGATLVRVGSALWEGVR